MNYQPLGRLMVGNYYFNTINEVIRAYKTGSLTGTEQVIDEDVGYICNVNQLQEKDNE